MSKEKEQDFSEIVHPDLLAAQKFAYEPHGLSIDKLKREAESQEYGAFELEMNNLRIKFRVAKITPTKIGQFVTLWKRIGMGPIQPYDREDPVDLFVVSVRRGERFGQFVFPKEVLCEKDIVSKEGKGGKRAMRVYPPWDIPDNRQAEKTQKWQLLYFFEIRPNQSVDTALIQKLFLAKL
jgi:hypothetical protein